MAELEGFEIGDPVAELYERNLTSSSAESKHVTAVLEAVADILRQEGIKPSPTAVFAASLSSLERANTEASPEMSAAMLTVLGARSTPPRARCLADYPTRRCSSPPVARRRRSPWRSGAWFGASDSWSPRSGTLRTRNERVAALRQGFRRHFQPVR